MFNRAKAALSGVKKNLSNILPLMFPKGGRVRIGAGFLLSHVSSALNVLGPLVFGQMVATLPSKKPTVVMDVEISPEAMVVIYGGIWTLNNMLIQYRNLVFTPIGPQVSKDLVLRYIKNEIEQSLDHDESTPQGDRNNLLARCYTAPNVLSTQMFTQVIPTATDISIAIGVLGKYYGWEIGLGLGGILAVYTAYNVSTKKLVTKLRSEMVDYGFKAYTEMVNTTDRYMSLHMFGRKEDQIAKLTTAVIRSMEADIAGMAIIPKIGIGQALLAGVGFSSLSYLVAEAVSSGKYTVSDFVFVISYLIQFAGPLSALGTTLNNFLASLTEIDAVLKALEKRSEIIDAYPLVPLTIARPTAQIEFKNVSFEYEPKASKEDTIPGEDKPMKKTVVLNNVSFRINAGEHVGIVGSSGSGKSSIVKLLYRFVDPQNGVILIDGQDSRKVGITSLRKLFAIVPQSTTLFADTFYNNVAYGAPCPLSEVKKEDVENAIDAACLTSTVNALPKGLETEVGEKGAKLSGGQRQRVAIGRALLKESKILIFDEATSALDAKSEKDVQENIKKIAARKTAIFIAHRLLTLIEMDTILVLSAGKIIEQGTHLELIAKGGFYAELWKEQNQLGAASEEKVERKTSLPVSFIKSPKLESHTITIHASDGKREELSLGQASHATLFRSTVPNNAKTAPETNAAFFSFLPNKK